MKADLLSVVNPSHVVAEQISAFCLGKDKAPAPRASTMYRSYMAPFTIIGTPCRISNKDKDALLSLYKYNKM